MYSDTAHVTNSLISNGCIIEGTVENSVIGRGVKIKKGAIVRNSIIMQNAFIDETANLNYAILDKNVVISKKEDALWSRRESVCYQKKRYYIA